MNEDWFPRLLAAIDSDGRSKRAISMAAGLGPNFVQQMSKDGKVPGADKLLAILNALGTARTFYVLTGIEMRAEDEEMFREFLSLPVEMREKLLGFARSFRGDVA